MDTPKAASLASRRARRPTPVVLILAVLVSGHLSTTAAAQQSCTFDPSTRTATFSTMGLFGDVTVERDIGPNPAGDGISIRVDRRRYRCGSVSELDIVNIDMAGSRSSLEFSLDLGPLGPGFTAEADGTSEVEFNVTNAQSVAYLSVLGTRDADVLRAGSTRLPQTFETIHVINLNAGAESTPDNDVAIRGTPPPSLMFEDLGGSDDVRASGTGTILAAPALVPVEFNHRLGTDTLVGGNADDLFNVFSQKGPGDSYAGGGGFDLVSWENRSAAVHISLNGAADDGEGCPGLSCEGDNVAPDVEWLKTGSGNDVLVGAAGAQLLDGGDGNNDLSGAEGPDIFLLGGLGADDADGGPGVDTASYDGRTEAVTVSLDGEANDGKSGEADNVRESVENVYGTSANDQIFGNDADNGFAGGKGDDVLSGEGGDDLLDGGGFRTPVVADQRDGSDTFFGGGGTDMVLESGHSGPMSLSLDNRRNDGVVGDPLQGVDNIRADVEQVTGGAGADVIVGNAKPNKLVGGAGDDELQGLGGRDELLPGPGDDQVAGGPGPDEVSFVDALVAIALDLVQREASGDGNDRLASIERATGSPFDDELTGSARANVLTGGLGDDILRGLGGNDTLNGSGGADTLDGGGGVDECNQGPGSGPKAGCE